MKHKVEFYKHSLDERDIARVVKVLRGHFLTTGAEVAEFERKFAAYTSKKHCITVNSCTAGLHLSLLAAGIGPGDEVIVPAMSFIATANAVEYVGAKPVFVDSEVATGNIDASLIAGAITPNTKAIIAVHLYGQLCDMKAISKIAKKHKLVVIEDAAHALESMRDGYVTGTYADFVCYSFYATKNLTCAEGGAVTTDSARYDSILRRLRLHGMSKNAADRYHKRYEHYDMEMLGFKSNLTNVAAAMMIHQLDRIKTLHKKRESLCRVYEKKLAKVPGITLMQILAESSSARHLMTIQVDPKLRDSVLGQLQDAGIGVAVNFRPIHLMRYYRQKYGYKPGRYPVAELIGSSTITLPLYPKLTSIEQAYVIETIDSIMRQPTRARLSKKST